jgi:hypothetical protein
MLCILVNNPIPGDNLIGPHKQPSPERADPWPT